MSNTTEADAKLAAVKARWDAFAVNFTENANKRVTWQCARELHTHMQLESAKNVLEVAAGGGIGSKDIISRMQAKAASTGETKRLTVTDLAPTMVEIAKNTLQGAGGPQSQLVVDIREANGQDLKEIPTGTIDRYITNLCLQLAPDPDALLREARRVLTDDGLAGFTIWGEEAHSGLFAIDAMVAKELGQGDGSPHNNFAMSKLGLDALRQRFQAAGFSQTRIWSFLCVLELWSGEEFANFFNANYPVEDNDVRTKRFEVAKRLANEWLAKGYPIGLETYIIIAKPLTQHQNVLDLDTITHVPGVGKYKVTIILLGSYPKNTGRCDKVTEVVK